MDGAGLLIDDREDARLFQELSRFTIPVHSLRLESVNAQGQNVSHGDAMFAGHGPDGQVQIGFERKKLDDLVQCLKDRRLSRQLRDMRETCEYDRIYVVVEGLWKPSQNGMIEVMNGGGMWRAMYARDGSGITYEQIDGFLQSIAESGVQVVRTATTQETAAFYVSRYRWWQKPYNQHSSMDGIYSTDPENQKRGRMVVHRGPPNPVCQTVAQWPGLDSKSWSVGEQYGSVFELVAGHPMSECEYKESVDRWMRTTWTDSAGKVKRFGKKVSQEIVNYLRGSK